MEINTKNDASGSGDPPKAVSINEIDSKTYRVTVELGDGSQIETACRLVWAEGTDGTVINAFDFDSDIFERKIALGEINIRAIYKAVLDFRHSKSSNT